MHAEMVVVKIQAQPISTIFLEYIGISNEK